MDKQKAIELIEQEKKVLSGMSKEEKLLTVWSILFGVVVGLIGSVILRWIF